MIRRNLRKKQRCDVRPSDLCPSDGSTETLLQKTAAITGRPIKVVDKQLPRGGPSGVWIALPGRDLVVLDTEGTPTRRESALCHEIGHIVLGHSPNEGDLTNLFPALDPALVTTFLGQIGESALDAQPVMFRCGYEDRQEQEAERFATELLSALLDSRNPAISHAHNRVR